MLLFTGDEFVVSDEESEPELIPVSKRAQRKNVESSRTSRPANVKAAASRGKAPIRAPKGPASKKARTSLTEPTASTEPSCADWRLVDLEAYYRARVDYNPYEHIQTSEKFFCEMYEDIHRQIYCTFKGPVVEQRHFNVSFLAEHYPHEMKVLQFHEIDRFMAIRQDYSLDLIKEFFATVYFSDVHITKRMTWMSAGINCTKTIRECAIVWGITPPFTGDPAYIRVHNISTGTYPCTPYLDMAYPPGGIDAPRISAMTPRYQLYTKILKNTIALKGGDKGMARGWLINTLYHLEGDKRFDLLDYIFNEIRSCVLDRRCCVLAPYIQRVIESCIGKPLADTYERIQHKLCSIDAPKVLPPPPTPDPRYGADNHWKAMMKKLFCMQVDTHKQNYKLHVDNKKIRSNQKKLMRHQGIPVDSGSEDVITSESVWMARHSSTWELDDASSSRAPRTDDDDAPDA